MGQSAQAIAQRLDAAIPAVYGQFIVANADPATPKPLKATTFHVHRFWGYARKGYRTPNNTGTVWVGPASANDEQPTDIAAGMEFNFPHMPGLKYDLNKIYLDVVTADDALVVCYFA
jgi:hypothetical protein